MDIESYKMAQIINQARTEAEDLVVGQGRDPNIQRIQKSITSRTGRRWLARLGYKWKEVRKGVYKDGHERLDVITSQNEVFLPALHSRQSRLMVWDENLV